MKSLSSACLTALTVQASSDNYLKGGLDWFGDCSTGKNQSPINLINGTTNEKISAKIGTFGKKIVPKTKLTFDDPSTGFTNLVPDYYWWVDLA